MLLFTLRDYPIILRALSWGPCRRTLEKRFSEALFYNIRLVARLLLSMVPWGVWDDTASSVTSLPSRAPGRWRMALSENRCMLPSAFFTSQQGGFCRERDSGTQEEPGDLWSQSSRGSRSDSFSRSLSPFIFPIAVTQYPDEKQFKGESVCLSL